LYIAEVGEMDNMNVSSLEINNDYNSLKLFTASDNVDEP
jgi:hypothetical protein